MPAPRPSAPAPGPADGSPPNRRDRVRAYRLLLTLAAVTLVLDQLTKAWIVAKIPFAAYPSEWPHPGSIPVIEGFFHLVHVGNTGAAWSLFAGQSYLLAALAVATLAAIFVWRRALELHHPRVQLAFGLLTGGVVGNLLDRVRHGHVVDFLDFHFGSYVYPTFNIADSGICIGVVLYLWHSFQEPSPGP